MKRYIVGENNLQNCDVACRHAHFEKMRRLHRSVRFLKPLFILFNIIIIYLLFRWTGMKAVGIIFAVFICVKEIIQWVVYRRMERLIFKPMDELDKGFQAIAQGNYDVAINESNGNEFNVLVVSFNKMAAELRDSESRNQEYEKNRKAMIANISHDLKTPITSILGYIEMILDEELVDTEKRNKYLKIIYSNSQYMNRLIDDLFLFSRLDMDKMDFNYEVVNVRAYMNDLMSEFIFDFTEKGMVLEYYDLLDNELNIQIDRKRIYQSINNIISNAIKYGPGATLKLLVELSNDDHYVSITISDNGKGIDPDMTPYIFDRFYRIDRERSKDLTSTGLGLAISKELIEAQGGKISVSSVLGNGTCFSISIPIFVSGKEVSP